MVKITFIEHGGAEHVIEAEAGQSVMQVAKTHDVPGILADCGGQCACCTCLVLVEPSCMHKVGSPNAVEESLMQISIDMEETSRLSCQIEVSERIDGLIVRIPEEQLG